MNYLKVFHCIFLYAFYLAFLYCHIIYFFAQNSVLHKALIENGYTDFETVPRSSNISVQTKGEDNKLSNSQPGCGRTSYTFKVDWMSQLLLSPSLLNELVSKLLV